MGFWGVAQLQPAFGRDQVAVRHLHLARFRTYLPRLRDFRVVRGRRTEIQPPLFPGYLFVWIEAQWYAICSTPGVVRLIRAGDCPAQVPDFVVDELRSRERDGLVELAQPRRLRHGDRVRIVAGPFSQHLAIYDGMNGHERVAVLLTLLGGVQRTTLAKADIEAFDPT